jgi:tetratricopeptide (TPR) repeat protein
MCRIFFSGLVVLILASCSASKRMEKNRYYFNLATSSENSNEYVLVVKFYSKAIRFHKKDTLAYHGRGLCKNYLGDLNGASKDFDKALQLNLNYYEAYSNRGMVKVKQEKYEEALIDFNKSIEIKPGYNEALLGKGSVYFKKRDFRSAIECYTRVLNYDSTNALVYFQRGQSFFEWDKLNAACADWHKANQLGFTDAKALMRKHCSK